MNKPIYIYLTPCFPSPESWRGGFCYDAVKALMRDGRYDVRVLTSSPGEDYDYHGIHVYRFHKFAIGCSDYLPFLTNPLKIHYFAKKLREMGLKPADIAVCHVHLFENYAPYATWLKCKNPKCLTLLHHHWTGKHGLSNGKLDWVPGLRAWLYLYTRKHLEAADEQIFCSEVSKAAFARYFPNGELAPSVDMKMQLRFPHLFRSVCLGNSFVCYNGIDSTLFHPAQPKPQMSTSFSPTPTPTTHTYKIGCVGNFTPSKSQTTLIEAVQILTLRRRNAEKLEVVFVGSGAKLAACKAFSCKLEGEGVKISFLSEMQHDLLPDFYHSLDLFVLPSYYEAFNCVFIEALGCGVPIIGCANVSIREVISKEDAAKWLFPPQNATALADCIERAIIERPRAQKLTRNLDIDVVTKNFLSRVDEKRRSL